jgi:hypothetical protein
LADRKFNAVKTAVGIVTTKWVIERPMIFKGSIAQAHGRTGTFAPGFGCKIGDAVQASCSAYPYFNRKIVTTNTGDNIELVDGGYCANNPTLYAIADAIGPLNIAWDNLRVISLGVGEYPAPKPPLEVSKPANITRRLVVTWLRKPRSWSARCPAILDPGMTGLIRLARPFPLAGVASCVSNKTSIEK